MLADEGPDWTETFCNFLVLIRSFIFSLLIILLGILCTLHTQSDCMYCALTMQVLPVQTEVSRYGGESSGIKSNVARSVKIK